VTITAPEDRKLRPAEPPTLPKPAPVAIHLRAPTRVGLRERFEASDPPPGWDLTRHPRVARVVRDRRFQFLLILPNQIIFWAVIFLGILGTAVPGINFATAITWYVWFCLVFVLMVVVGRGWCAMCPFGGFAEWLQRRTFWRRTQKALGLGRKLPEPVARYGLLWSVGAFLLLTWIEERFNIAAPGTPADTGWMVVGIVASAVAVFLIFERRTFCRYLCPLSALIGTVGSMGSVAGFRTRDREACLTCATKDCMRGGAQGYGCPWYTWPGSADSNLTCGLCSECYKACPSDNVGLFVQKPLTSVVAPRRRRADVAWTVMLLWGLVMFQQVNATSGYATADSWLSRVTHLGPYPNPVDYVGIIGAIGLATAGLTWVASRFAMRHGADASPAGLAPAAGTGALPGLDGAGRFATAAQAGCFVDRTSRFRSFFVPVAYGLIPVVGSDYLARQLPKFFKHALRIVPTIGSWFGVGGGTHSSLYHAQILTNSQIVIAQVVVVALGMAASLWATWRISGRDVEPLAAHPLGARAAALALVVACGTIAGFLYVIMHAAS
jgi:NosR/NirI family nitrous oxide reductase transcriptional regulator